MKQLTLLLPDSIFTIASEEAKKHDVDVPLLCLSVLSDYFISSRDSIVSSSAVIQTKEKVASTAVSEGRFDVAAAFEGFPRHSIELAQRFVNKTQRFGRVRAYRNRRGIGFKPNFVFIEYLMSRSGTGGIGVSFYGEPHRHSNPPSILVKGIPSYSRAKIYSPADLDLILPHIKQSYELKFGRI